MPTLRDVAAACGVSPATVSKALNNAPDVGQETAQRIRQRAKELGYHPNAVARTLKTNRSYSIGVLFEDEMHSGLTHEFFSSVLDALKNGVESRGYDVTFISRNLGAASMSYLDHCRYRNCDGVVIANVDFRDPSVAELVASGIPAVTIDYVFDGTSAVMSDNARGMRELVTYVHSQGHRDFALIHGEETAVTRVRMASFYRTCRVALIGNYHGTASRYTTVLEGIQDELGQEVRVLYSQGCHLFKDRVENLGKPDDRLAEAVTVTELADVTVLVLGLDETLEGEEGDTGNADASGDKLSLLLPEPQRKLADAVLATGKPVILCLMAGSSIDISAIADKCAGVLLLWYPGAQGGKTAADILFGRVSPSGKLPVTFYHNEDLEKMPPFEDYTMKNRTYRYFESPPLYPFGYGLTYGDVTVTAAGKCGQGIRATLCNSGSRDTEEVVQVYVQNEGSTLTPRNPRLCAFRRVAVPAGQTVSVELIPDARTLLAVDADGKRIEDGTPVFYVGLGQPDPRTRQLTGKKSIPVK